MAQSLHIIPPTAVEITCGATLGADRTGTQPTMRIDQRPLFSLLRVAILGGLALAVCGTAAGAEPEHVSLSGTYRCVSVEVAGKAKHCTAPSIEMNSDGSYDILSEHGTYEIVRGNWLVLSASKHHGHGRLDSNNKQIIFEFLSGGKKSKITYRRKYQRPPAWVSG
jgi:hypothetical protein